ncbi:Tyrosine phosphatase family protein [Gemmata sp. SH-PL17]|uniref:dual specificity protein phosphatase family protein n=1 Tax=Gemmata sp. SH-PL17 TaxID=1630693 RepID=UPI0004BA7748|nr:dual specificity protein phosphatase family protein [Gemmata sp. SH-PL17]AMV26136.1 Tyrosine phosphatase family protein [Gemmata sp. SH-PL17]
MPSRWQFILAATALAVVVAAPLVYSAHQNTHMRNFRVVEDGVLYRSGQLTPKGMDRVLSDYNIKTVVTLRVARQPGAKSPDAWEEDVCAARGLNHVRIVPRVWGADEDGEIPAEQAVQEFLAVVDKKENHPILVHCFAGIHRTGTMCAIFRMEYHKWSPERAMSEMQLYGFAPEDMHQHIAGYLREYKPRSKPLGK